MQCQQNFQVAASASKQTIWQAAPPVPRRAQPNSFITPAFDGQAMIEIPNLPLVITHCSLDLQGTHKR